ncbi:MAG: GLPGLI family protein [Bacteroidota bacterium]
MQKLSLLLCTCLMAFSLQAQKEGEILFKEVMKIEIQLPEDSPIPIEELKKMMPSEQVSKQVLYFTDKATLYTAEPQAEQAESEFNHEGEGVRIQMKMVGASTENKVFVDLKKEQLIQQQDFMGKTFIVQDDEPKLPWKLGTEQKEILGYNCRQATATIDDREVEAWFTTELAIPSGPANYYGLPGMILEVQSKSENGERKIIATAINEKALEKDLLKAPNKGKKVTSEQYRKIVEEKTKEMQEQMGGRNGTFIIRG